MMAAPNVARSNPTWTSPTSMNKPPIKIAVAQGLISADVREDGLEILELMRRVRSEGSVIVHFPEGAMSGCSKARYRDLRHPAMGLVRPPRERSGHVKSRGNKRAIEALSCRSRGHRSIPSRPTVAPGEALTPNPRRTPARFDTGFADRAGNHLFSVSSTNSNNALVPGLSSTPRSALILL